MDEKAFVESTAGGYLQSGDTPYRCYMRQFQVRKIAPYLKRPSIGLELSCAIGYMTSLIAPLVDHLDVVEGSAALIEAAKRRGLPNVTFYESLFENWQPEKHYDYVFASHVLEHVADDIFVMRLAWWALKPGGLFFVAVPNATPPSRQLARHMGLLEDLYELTPNDLKGGHRRVYNHDSLAGALKRADFELVEVSGILFKPLADFQMDQLQRTGVLEESHFEGLFRLGEDYPRLCGDVFCVARKPEA